MIFFCNQKEAMSTTGRRMHQSHIDIDCEDDHQQFNDSLIDDSVATRALVNRLYALHMMCCGGPASCPPWVSQSDFKILKRGGQMSLLVDPGHGKLTFCVPDILDAMVLSSIASKNGYPMDSMTRKKWWSSHPMGPFNGVKAFQDFPATRSAAHHGFKIVNRSLDIPEVITNDPFFEYLQSDETLRSIFFWTLCWRVLRHFIDLNAFEESLLRSQRPPICRLMSLDEAVKAAWIEFRDSNIIN